MATLMFALAVVCLLVFVALLVLGDGNDISSTHAALLAVSMVGVIVSGGVGMHLQTSEDERRDDKRAQRLLGQAVAAQRGIYAERGSYAGSDVDFEALAPEVANSIDKQSAAVELEPGSLSGAVRVSITKGGGFATELLRPRRPAMPAPGIARERKPAPPQRRGPYGNGTLTPNQP